MDSRHNTKKVPTVTNVHKMAWVRVIGDRSHNVRARGSARMLAKKKYKTIKSDGLTERWSSSHESSAEVATAMSCNMLAASDAFVYNREAWT